jgi:hypothetical protein
MRSVQSFAQLFTPVGQVPPNLIEARQETAVNQTIAAKKEQYSWGLLSGLIIEGNAEFSGLLPARKIEKH